MVLSRTARVPGRVTIIGGHTGDNKGVLISVAIPRYVQVTIEDADRGFLSLESDAFDGRSQFSSLDRIEPHWAKYIVGALFSAGLSEQDILRLTIRVTSDLPMRRGLASSAALVAATLLAANERLAELPRDELLQLCANVEREYAGVNCGVLDYYTNLFAVEGHFLKIDCKFYTHETIRWPAEISLMICDPGKPRQLAGSEFNLRRAQCNAVAKAAGKESLRDVSQAELDLLRGEMPVEVKRADHVLAENKRVGQFAKEVRARNFSAVKSLMSSAHRSLATNYECSSFEQDLLVAEADKIDCCVGSRLTGAGWGGVTIHLVQRGREDELAAGLCNAYRSAMGSTPQLFVLGTMAGGWLSDHRATAERKLSSRAARSGEQVPIPVC